MRVGVLLLALIAGTAPALAASPVDYTLAPVLERGRLASIAVTLCFAADASGRSEFDLPDHYAGQKQLWKSLRDVAVDGAHARLLPGRDPAHIVVRADPGGAVTLRYRIVQGFAGEPGQDNATYYRPVVQPGYFHLLGVAAFVLPHGDKTRRVTFHAMGMPAGWSFASTLERKNLTVFDLELSVTVGGDFRIVRARDLRLAIRGHWRFSDADLARRVADIADSELRFWGDAGSPYLVTVLALKPDPLDASTGGAGQSGGFAMFLSPRSDDAGIDYGFAHERLHGWISGALGNSDRDDGPVGAWIAEGFTDYFARRILLATNLRPLDATVAALNRTLLAYDTSPARALPNARAAREMFDDPEIEQLPYWRGALLAMMWDARLREKGANMDAVARDMRARARRHPADTPRDNLVAAMDERGLDVRGDIARFIDRGEPIRLAPDAFAPCAIVSIVTIPDFDVGFDADATAKSGNVVRGVDAKGPAYAAGLRDGMTLVARLSPWSRDSRVARVYRVRDGARSRTISYLPRGRGIARVQAAALDPRAQRQACLRVFSASNPR